MEIAAEAPLCWQGHEIKEDPDSGTLPEDRPTILKLYGTCRGDRPFLLSSEHVDRLANCMEQLPHPILNVLLRETFVFIGHSPNDPELQRVLTALLRPTGYHTYLGNCVFIHQCYPGSLDCSFYTTHFGEQGATFCFVTYDEFGDVLKSIETEGT